MHSEYTKCQVKNFCTSKNTKVIACTGVDLVRWFLPSANEYTRRMYASCGKRFSGLFAAPAGLPRCWSIKTGMLLESDIVLCLSAGQFLTSERQIAECETYFLDFPVL